MEEPWMVVFNIHQKKQPLYKIYNKCYSGTIDCNYITKGTKISVSCSIEMQNYLSCANEI